MNLEKSYRFMENMKNKGIFLLLDQMVGLEFSQPYFLTTWMIWNEGTKSLVIFCSYIN